MKRKKTTLEGCAIEIYMAERCTKEERSSKRHDIRSKVSREDTRSSGSMVEEDEVISPLLVRYVVTYEEDGAHSSSANAKEDSDGSLYEGEYALAIVSKIVRLKVGSSFGIPNRRI